MLHNTLLRRYLQVLIPALALLLIAQWWQVRYGQTPLFPVSARLLNTTLLMLSVALALVAPVLYRLNFAGRQRRKTHTELTDFISYQKRSITVALAAAYLTPLALVLPVAGVTRYGVLLLALYGAYYYYPSAKKISFEKRLFRVRDEA